MDATETFEHAEGFEQGEVLGNVRLGRFEAHYEELFADVIEDGVITAEERARLDKAADAFGLDRTRLRLLEEVLQASYASRHKVTVREDIEEPRASLSPFAAAPDDDRTAGLRRRITLLEERIAELEQELEEARENVSVEVDLSGFAAPAVEETETAIERATRALRVDVRDPEALRALYSAASQEGQADRAIALSHALVYIGAANEAERKTFRESRPVGLIQPARSLSVEAWKRLLFHPDEEILTGEILAAVASAVLLGRVAALRHAKALVVLDPTRRQDPATSTVQAVRCFAWSASILGMAAPPLYADPDFEGLVAMVPGVPPASRLGKLSLSGRSPSDLAFVAGRHLAGYREEHFLRKLLPSIEDLEDIFLAALLIGNPGLPLNADMKARVTPVAAAIQPILEPLLIDRLRGHFLRFVEEGGRTNLQRWAHAADATATRAGLLLCDDLATAERMLTLEQVPDVAAKMNDLLAFVISDRFTNLRKQLGIAA